MNVKEEVLFPSYMHIIQYDDDLADKLAVICSKENKLKKDLTDKEWNKYNVLDWTYPEIRELENRLSEASLNYLEKYSTNKYKSITFIGWANVRKGISYHMTHTHANSDLVLNYYVKTPDNSKIVYFDPAPARASNKWITDEYKELTVKTGMLIITPPWILHEVPPTYSDEERISISVNGMLL